MDTVHTRCRTLTLWSGGMTDQQRPRWADLTMYSTRDEVLAAVAEHEKRIEGVFAAIKAGDPSVLCCSNREPRGEHWWRDSAGDVVNRPAFDEHMDQVGEENQDPDVGWPDP